MEGNCRRSGSRCLPQSGAAALTKDVPNVELARQALDTGRAGRIRDDVARVTQDLAHRFEELIRVAPEHWHLMQPNWPSDRPLDPMSTEGSGHEARTPRGVDQKSGLDNLSSFIKINLHLII